MMTDEVSAAEIAAITFKLQSYLNYTLGLGGTVICAFIINGIAFQGNEIGFLSWTVLVISAWMVYANAQQLTFNKTYSRVASAVAICLMNGKDVKETFDLIKDPIIKETVEETFLRILKDLKDDK